MMKLWSSFVNNGNWGRYHTLYVIAENQEQAELKMKLEDYRIIGYEASPAHEVTGEDILNTLGVLPDKREGFSLDYILFGGNK